MSHLQKIGFPKNWEDRDLSPYPPRRKLYGVATSSSQLAAILLSASIDDSWPRIPLWISARAKTSQEPYQGVMPSFARARVACSLMVGTSPHLPNAAITSASSNNGSWAKPRPFSTAQRLTTTYWPSVLPPK